MKINEWSKTLSRMKQNLSWMLAAFAALIIASACQVSPQAPVDSSHKEQSGQITENALSGLKMQTFQSGSVVGNQIYERFKLVNTGTTAVTLSGVKIRYYFMYQGSPSYGFACDYTPVGSGNVTGTFIALNPAKAGADAYHEISFTSGAGSIAAGASMEIQCRIWKTDWSNLDNAKNYSYNPSTSSVDFNKVTVYLSGVLEWGLEPGGAAASVSSAVVSSFHSSAPQSASKSSSQSTSKSSAVSSTPVQTGSMKIIWPAYWYPGDAKWATLTAKAKDMPGRIWAIINPNNGPGTAKDQNYVNQINTFRAAGGKIIGYVSTYYGDNVNPNPAGSVRTVAAVNQDINRWYDLYAIDGIFFDEQATQWDSDYATYCTTVRSRNAGALCVGNAGTDYGLAAQYYDWMNLVVLWENNYSGFNSYWPAAWIQSKGGERNAALLCNLGSFDSSLIDHAKAAGINYICEFNGGTWDWGTTFPAYFNQFADYVKGK